MHVTAIVLAAGAGRRVGGAMPKTFLPIAGRPLVLRTVDRMFSARTVADVVLVVAASELERCQAMLRADDALRNRPWRLQTGGITRQQSAKRGLEKLGAETEIVIIHDGARPFVSANLIDRCVESASSKGAVVVGIAARDTIKVVDQDRRIQSTPERSSLWEIQTPQVFRRDLIVAAHEQAEKDGCQVTDDAMVVERMGTPVFVLDGERTNFKITVPEDVWLAEMLIREGRVS
ncbi:MAG TPA: 2-C-methyl-D-erythritol 4-phosphate cytidylyltransferase [Candidatus Binatia bacterium]|nr:2-C-methyl-D-erythritol 4-phosphate cytidylyltransferase [Candidatus Binatia bacterium]